MTVSTSATALFGNVVTVSTSAAALFGNETLRVRVSTSAAPPSQTVTSDERRPAKTATSHNFNPRRTATTTKDMTDQYLSNMIDVRFIIKSFVCSKQIVH